MKLSERAGCDVCQSIPENKLNSLEVQEAVKKDFGNKAFVEVNGIIKITMADNVDLEIDLQDMKMMVTGNINLQSHDPMEGVPDYDKYISQVARLPMLSGILLKNGFSPTEWGVNEFRGPGNGMCSVLMSKPITGSSIEELMSELKMIEESLRKLDS